MVTFTESERAFLTEMRSITTNAQGREILVGLTEEETAFYMEHTRQFPSQRADPTNKARYLKLHEKHELARLSVLGAEVQLRNENPSRH